MQNNMKRSIKSAYFNQGILMKLILISIAVIALFFLFAYEASTSTYCAPYAYKQCAGKSLYWYDSCGNQQDAQYCPNGCYNNQCQTNNNNYNYNSCVSHAYRLCAGNNVYWYDSCGNQQDVYQNCYGTNQTCQYGQCLPAQAGVYQQPVSPYIVYYKTACYGNNLYWYDTLGAVTGFYKSCSDSNSCTADNCGAGKCSNTVKCDGSTCQTGSEDYIKYCAADKSHCGNGTCEANLGETTSACPNDCKAVELSISFFAKQDAASSQWQKSVQLGQNSQVYFMLTAANNGTSQIDNVVISADIPGEVVSLGNVQIDGTAVSRDIVSGVNIGSLATSSSKTITLEGKTQLFSTSQTKQVAAKAEAGGASKTDSLEIIFNPSQMGGAAVSGAVSSDFWEFLKRWYLLILIGLVLFFLFMVVFRRLSTNA